MTTMLPHRSLPALKMTAVAVPQTPTLPVQDPFFAPGVQQELAQSDHEAWTAVCAILITIVTAGLLLGIGGVLLTL